MITKKQIDEITDAAADARMQVIHMRRHSKTLYNSDGEQITAMEVKTNAHVIIVHPSSESLYKWILEEKEHRNEIGF